MCSRPCTSFMPLLWTRSSNSQLQFVLLVHPTTSCTYAKSIYQVERTARAQVFRKANRWCKRRCDVTCKTLFRHDFALVASKAVTTLLFLLNRFYRLPWVALTIIYYKAEWGWKPIEDAMIWTDGISSSQRSWKENRLFPASVPLNSLVESFASVF